MSAAHTLLAPLEMTRQCDNQEQQRKKKYLENNNMAGMFQVAKLGKEQDVYIACILYKTNI